MTSYVAVKWLTDGVVIATSQFGQQMFTRGALRKKPRDCAVCGASIPRGAEAYRPLTNGYNRMHRVHEGCFR